MRMVQLEQSDRGRPAFPVWNVVNVEALKEKLGDTFDRDLTAAETSEYDGLKAQYDTINSRLGRQSQFEAISETMRPGRRSTPEGPNAELYGGSARRNEGTGALDRIVSCTVAETAIRGPAFR